MSDPRIHVVKLGGSLLDPPGLTDLAARLARWFAAELGPRGLVVAGGGAAADRVRAMDAALHFAPEKSHWLAIRAMDFNAHLLAAAIERAVLVEDPQACTAAWAAARLPIVSPVAWLKRQQGQGTSIPHRWSFTSDSIAAHIATQLGAGRLTLLKSTLPDSPCSPEDAARLAIVNEDFPSASRGLPRVELVNLRSQGFDRHVLRE